MWLELVSQVLKVKTGFLVWKQEPVSPVLKVMKHFQWKHRENFESLVNCWENEFNNLQTLKASKEFIVGVSVS